MIGDWMQRRYGEFDRIWIQVRGPGPAPRLGGSAENCRGPGWPERVALQSGGGSAAHNAGLKNRFAYASLLLFEPRPGRDRVERFSWICGSRPWRRDRSGSWRESESHLKTSEMRLGRGAH